MKNWLRNAWYVAIGSAELAAGKPVARTILGEPVVLIRDARGEVFALEDRCAHRGAPLSLGRLVGETRIQCPYHGLEFDMTGQCVRNPHGKGGIPPECRLRSYPVAERFGMLWLWTGDRAPDMDKLPVSAVLEPADRRLCSPVTLVRMAAPYEYVVDNLLDLSHVSVLHEGVLGNAATLAADIEVSQKGDSVTVRRSMRAVPPPEYSDLMFRGDGKPVDLWHDIRWEPPGNLLLDVGVTAPGGSRLEGTGSYGGHFLTPETEASTHYHFIAVRQNPIKRSEADEARVMARMAELRVMAFTQQDEPMIRAQYENIRTAGIHWKPCLLEVDSGVERWHRVMKRLLKEEQSPAVASLGRAEIPELKA